MTPTRSRLKGDPTCIIGTDVARGVNAVGAAMNDATSDAAIV